MEQSPTTSLWKTRLVFGVIGVVLACAGAGSWFHYWFRLNDVPPLPAESLPEVRPMAKIMLAPQRPGAPVAPPSTPTSIPNVPERRSFHTERNPLNEFRARLNETLLHELAPTFAELQTVLSGPDENGRQQQYQRVVFQLLDAAKTATGERRPAILFAADLVAIHLGCDRSPASDAANSDCARLKTDLARYDLTLKYDELGAGSYYPRDLLWRIWAQYPQTAWGERAFVLLLDRGWDTSYTCEKGGDQTREVIRQGESFLRQRPNSPYRAVVTLLMAEAYASWWSLSKEPAGSAMSDYVDPKQFQQGAEEARLKAIAYLEEVLQLAPGTGMGRFAGQVLPPLRDPQILDNYRFFCVYD